MPEEEIAEIGIDESDGLFVRPKNLTFEFVYRAAMGVSWDEARNALICPAPDEWDYFRWFRRVISAVDDEYGVRLTTNANTVWTNIADTLRSEIETSCKT